jgi:hypothetical protein
MSGLSRLISALPGAGSPLRYSYQPSIVALTKRCTTSGFSSTICLRASIVVE